MKMDEHVGGPGSSAFMNNGIPGTSYNVMKLAHLAAVDI